MNGKLDVVRLLVMELGANVSQLYDGTTALCAAALNGHKHVVLALVQEFGADANQAGRDGDYALSYAAHQGHDDVVRYLLGECGANVNQRNDGGATTLYRAAQEGHEHIVRCLVKEFGANVNIAARDGTTPLMAAAVRKHIEIVVWLTKHGADSQASHPQGGTAADFSERNDAPAEQTAYLEARTHCAKPGCSGAGLKKCAGCLVIFYCCKECQVTHWSTHKAECKRSAAQTAGKGE
jgi:ankyrin repeat protein